MGDEFAEQDFPARDGIGQKQGEGAAFDLAGDGVERHQKGQKRDEVDGQRGQRGDDDREAVGAERAGGRRPGRRQDERKDHHQRDGDGDPAVAARDPRLGQGGGEDAAIIASLRLKWL